MKKAFMINGGAGRVLCALPALEYYKNNIDPEVVIISEAWMELFTLSPALRGNVYHVAHKDIFRDKLIDREIDSPEPYRLNDYFTQQCNLIQAFDKLINQGDKTPETKSIKLDISKQDQVYGYNLVTQVKIQFGKEKVVIIQPFGSGVQLEGNFVIDPSGRSFELNDFIKITEELSKHYAVILMLPFKIPTEKALQAAIPENIDLVKWAAIINASDYFLGCDSVGQHFANALNKPATVVVGSTFPENITYPDNKNFTIIDNGKDRRMYSPIRITHDVTADRNNEDLMILSKDTLDSVIKSVTNKLGLTKQPKRDIMLDKKQDTVDASPFTKKPTLLETLTSGI
jgi:hypothetical protein